MDTQSEQFRGMLKTFLAGPGENSQTKRAFKQLQQDINQFTKNRECWGVTLRILENQDSLEIKYFASNILKDKMKYDYGQLNPELFAAVHQSILKIISSHPKPQTGMLFNLSLALVYVYMHEAEIIGDLLQYLSSYLGKNGLINYVFTILMLLPEEIENYKVVIEERKRNYLTEYIRSIQTKVLVELNNCAAQNWEGKTIRKDTFLGCLANWVELDYRKEIMDSLPTHYVFNMALSLVGDPVIGKDCTDTLIIIIKTLKNSEQDKKIFLYMAQKIFQYFPIVKKFIQENRLDMCDYYINVICSFGRKLAPDFAKVCSQTSVLFQENIMFITKNAGLDNMESISKYWLKLCKKLYHTNSPTKVNYKPLLELLYQVLTKNAQFTMAECTDLNTQSEEALEKAHQDFQDKMRYRNSIDEIYEMIGELYTFQRCVEMSLALIYKVNTDSKNFWAELEALLLPLVDIIDKIKTPNAVLTQTIKKLVQLNPPFVCVQRSIIIVLSRCSKIYKTIPQITTTIFKFLVAQLNQAQLASVAAQAFENVCDNSTDFVVSNIQSFMEVFRLYKENEKILNGMVIAVATKSQYLDKYLPEICRPYVEQIAKRTSIDSIKTSIKRLNEIIEKASKGGNCDKIVLELFQTVWPLIKPFVQNPSIVQVNPNKNESIKSLIERSCKFIKACMRALRQKFAPFIEPVFNTIFTAYQKFPLASYVYIVEVVVTVFNSFPQCIQILNLIYARTILLTFNHLSKLDKFEQNPDLSEDFFGMNVRFMRYAPHIVLYCDQLDPLVKLCITACGVNHKQIANTLYKFIESLYNVFWDPNYIKYYNQMMESKEYEIVVHEKYKDGYKRLRDVLMGNMEMVGAMVGHLEKSPSQSVRESIRGTLEAEIQAFPKENVAVWTPILVQMGDDILTAQEKQEFLNQISKACLDNFADIQEFLYSISKRYIHRNTRAPIKS